MTRNQHPAQQPVPGPARQTVERPGEQLCLFAAAQPNVTPPPAPTPRHDSNEPTDRAALTRELEARLAPHFGGRLRSLVLTQNRRRILSVRPLADDRSARGHKASRQAELALRLDACFVHADDATLADVASWATGRPDRRQALARLRAFCDRRRPPEAEVEAPSRRLPAPGDLAPRGRCFDLTEFFDRLNRDYFDGEIAAGVSWGQATRRRATRRRTRRQTIRLGSYDYERRLIRIHPVLDRPQVPTFVVESVLHHEMVHAALPAIVRNGRRRFHTRHFRALERRYRHQEQADAWITANLDGLLKARYAKD
jgi:hypothetical protein